MTIDGISVLASGAIIEFKAEFFLFATGIFLNLQQK